VGNVLRDLVPEVFTKAPGLPDDFAAGRDPLVTEFALRFLFSCLVDADVLDTQAHRMGWHGPRVAPPMDAQLLLDRFVDRRKKHLAGRKAASGRNTGRTWWCIRSATRRRGTAYGGLRRHR
jgi:hypothetical protein